MKKLVAALFAASLLMVLIVLIFRPDLRERFHAAGAPGDGNPPVAVERPERPSPARPEPETRPEQLEASPPDLSTALILLDRFTDRSLYVNGTEQTGQARCRVAPGPATVATWKDGRYSHELLEIHPGEELSPEGRQQYSTPARTWAGFQGGPGRTGLADSPARTGLRVRWEGRVEDQVRSAPVIHDSMAFFASDSSFVRALDLSSGRLLWSSGIVGSKVNPVAVGEFVFAGNDVGRFEGFRADKGKVKGTISLGSGLASLSAADGDRLLASTSSGMLLAIATRKNMVGRLPMKTLWEVTVPGFAGSTATPLILGDRAILQATDGRLMAVSMADGSMIWPDGLQTTEGSADIPNPDADMTFRFIGSQGFLTPTPAADQGMIYAAHRNRLQAVKAGDGALLWEREFGSEAASSVSQAWGTLYLGCSDGTVHAFSCANGTLIFKVRLGEAPIFASPVLFDGQLLAATGEGKLCLLDAFCGRVLAEDNTLGGSPLDATPAVWESGILAINRSGRMACFE